MILHCYISTHSIDQPITKESAKEMMHAACKYIAQHFTLDALLKNYYHQANLKLKPPSSLYYVVCYKPQH